MLDGLRRFRLRRRSSRRGRFCFVFFAFAQAGAECVDALGHITHQAGNASPTEDQQNDQQQDQQYNGVSETTETHGFSSEFVKAGHRAQRGPVRPMIWGLTAVVQLFIGGGGYRREGRHCRKTDQLRPTLPVATRSAARLIELNDLRRAAWFGAFPAFFEPEFELQLRLAFVLIAVVPRWQ